MTYSCLAFSDVGNNPNAAAQQQRISRLPLLGHFVFQNRLQNDFSIYKKGVKQGTASH